MIQDDARTVMRLDDDLIGWLTTVDPQGQPQTSAVWFLREGDELLIYSRPHATRLRNLATNPRIAFNLRGDAAGDSVMTLEGIAAVEPGAATPIDVGPYMAKYGSEIERLGWTHTSFDEDFPVAVRIRVTRMRAW